jgi:2-polyprenyl-3-methyl-5-hydroxy-6-metoxy-1,4-benzoquinol methylase
MSVNTTNANKELGFDKMSDLDYGKHWSFSTFNRMLLAAYHISNLPINSRVLEIGAGTSELENLVCTNFQRKDIMFIKVDADEQYRYDDNIDFIGDVTDKTIDSYLENYINLNMTKFSAVVMMEVIEHVGKDKVKPLLDKIHDKWLKEEGLLIITTPTPPYNAKYEDKVWPTDHEYEFSLRETRAMVNSKFKIVHEVSWSMEERDYYRELRRSPFLMEVKARLESAGFPESYIRAQISVLASSISGRQILMIGKGRRREFI